VTYSALQAYVDKIAPSWFTMKGFVAGDAGAEDSGTSLSRERIQTAYPLASGVRTDARGLPDLNAKHRTISHVSA
jgi:hypothetical protein